MGKGEAAQVRREMGREKTSPAQDVVDVARHDGLDVVQVVVELGVEPRVEIESEAPQRFIIS